MSEHLLGMSKLGKSSSANAGQREHIRWDECELLLESVCCCSNSKTQSRQAGPMTLCKRVVLSCVLAFLLLFLLTGCSGLGLTSGGPTPTPSPAATPVGSLQSVNHIIFMMQENRSFDSYFGKINDYRASLGLGRDADDLENDFTAPADDGNVVTMFHLSTSCIYNTTAAWLECHGNANRFDTSDSSPLLLDELVN